MRWALLLALLPLAAHADLYRWIDPATGSVKFSSQPPSDPGIEPSVVRYNAPPTPKPTPAVQKPAVQNPTVQNPTAVADLETRWRALASQLVAMPPQEIKAGSDRVRQQAIAVEAARVELDRLDPGGAQRRSTELLSMMQRAQVNKTP